MGTRQPSPWAASSETLVTGGSSAFKVEINNTSKPLNMPSSYYYKGVEVEKLVRLNQALGVNLKPNEDLDDAGAGAMLPMSPMEALRTGSYHQNVTVMIGSNENDGLILTTPLTTDPSLYILYRYTVAHQQLVMILS